MEVTKESLSLFGPIAMVLLMVVGVMTVRDTWHNGRANDASQRPMNTVPIFSATHAAEPQAHHAKALLVRCMDFRFGINSRKAVMEGLKIHDFDEVAIAGASQALVDPLDPAFRQTVLKHIELAKVLHHIDTVVFEDHTAGEESGCGAYKAKYHELESGGVEAEEAKHVELLRRARDEVRKLHPDLRVALLLIKPVKAADGTVRDEVQEVI